MRFEEFLYPSQKGLFEKIRRMYPRTWTCKGKYILVQGDAPVMLVAHLDTVHKEPVRDICKSDDGNIWMSPQGIGGDDRCGVYTLVSVYEKSPVKPWLLFTCDEEIGGVGANAFCDDHAAGKCPVELSAVKFLVEIDRKGRNDAVYYDCANDDFEKYITSKGFKTQFGSFSDISVVAPELRVAAVNLSSGYYNAHTTYEHINIRHMQSTIRRMIDIVADSVKPETPMYPYIENVCYGDFGYNFNSADYRTRLNKIPKDIRFEYECLLDYYSFSTLESVREEMGDAAIPMLYETEFGEEYDDDETVVEGFC